MNIQIKQFFKNDEWLECKRNYVTATMVPIILGLNKYQTVSKMLQEKDKGIPLDNAYIHLGILLEDVVIKESCRLLKKDFISNDGEKNAKNFFYEEALGIGATPDAHTDTELLECKTTQPKNWIQWRYLPPPHYLAQLFFQLICTNRQIGYLSIMSSNVAHRRPELQMPISIYKVTREPKLENIIMGELRRYNNTQKAGKTFLSNRKLAEEIKIRLYLNMEKVI